jgi:hypothetical protein
MQWQCQIRAPRVFGNVVGNNDKCRIEDKVYNVRYRVLDKTAAEIPILLFLSWNGSQRFHTILL